MKFLLLTLTLTLFVSCGKKATTETSNQDSEANSLEESGYGLPRIGFHREVNLNYRMAHAYEDLTVDPQGKKEVLGEMPFFLFLSEDNTIKLQFYSKQDIKNVSYLDLDSDFEKTTIKLFDKKILNHQYLQEAHVFRRYFTYGEANLDYPEQDMLNKVFIVETEQGDLPFVSNMTTMFWVECHGGFNYKNKNDYSCPHGKIKFNYKLLDYSLTKRVE
jgi:hypothetical protein